MFGIYILPNLYFDYEVPCPYCGGYCNHIDPDDGSSLECCSCDGWLDFMDSDDYDPSVDYSY